MYNSIKFDVEKFSNEIQYRDAQLETLKYILVHPEVKLLFKDVGIIGTAIDGFDDVGAKSTPMINTDIEKAVWEIALYLKPGAVKFRCRDSWAQNWGGSGFPEGDSGYDGGNILIPEAGNYHITLNLTESWYKFTRM